MTRFASVRCASTEHFKVAMLHCHGLNFQRGKTISCLFGHGADEPMRKTTIWAFYVRFITIFTPPALAHSPRTR